MTLLNAKTGRKIVDVAGRLDRNELRLAGKLRARRITETIFRLDCDEDHPDDGSHEDFIIQADSPQDVAELEALL